METSAVDDRPLDLDSVFAGADWIAPVEPADIASRQRSVFQLAGSVDLGTDIASATLHITAHGIYEAFVNGERVGDRELTPGWTAYRSRLQVQSYDVTHLVAPGTNVVGALLSDGWWRGQNSVARRVDDYGETTALLAVLHVENAAGERSTFASDASWRSTPSHILGADLIAGEVHDLRERRDWTDRAGWTPVRVEDHGTGALVEPIGRAVKRIEELRPVDVRRLDTDRWVVDFGQNISGWVRLTQLGPAGTQVTITHGEWTDRNGDVTQKHLFAESISTNVELPFQTDTVTSAGAEGDVFEPRHSTKGFQFVRVEGDLGELTTDDIAAVVVHTELDRIGDFACSDDRINALHRIADWSFRGNACDIPTDCPTRERAGWTGDWQLFVETAAFLYDVNGFSRKWLLDLAAAATADPGPVATAYLHRSARELSEMASLLGHTDDAERYAQLAVDTADAWRIEFLAPDATTTPDTQATYARALTFGLIPPDLQAAAADRLVALVRQAGNHLSTGFLATPFLLPVLADNGHLDVAYDLLFQDTEPSWLYMVDRGATTVWEEWGGIDADGTPHASLNHYSKGAVVSFLHQYVAGIQATEPGYRTFRIEPRPGGGITSARAHHDSPFGRISVDWAIDGDGFRADVEVPPGTGAEFVAPDGEQRTLSPGRHRV